MESRTLSRVERKDYLFLTFLGEMSVTLSGDIWQQVCWPKAPGSQGKLQTWQPLDRRDHQSHASGWAHVGTKVQGECEGKWAKSKLWETMALKEWTESTQPMRRRKIMARKVMSWKLLEGRAVSQFALCPQGLAQSEHQGNVFYQWVEEEFQEGSSGQLQLKLHSVRTEMPRFGG